MGDGHRVFISHSSSDAAVAHAACSALEAAGVKCWIAPRDIHPGAKWAASLIDAVETSSALLLIYSPRADASEQVLSEVNTAQNARVPVLTFRLEDFEMSKEMRFFLGSRHWLDAFPEPAEHHLPDLLREVQELLGAGPSPPAKAGPAGEGSSGLRAAAPEPSGGELAGPPPEILNPEVIRDSDVVIAYADLDDHPVIAGHRGWVSQLHENLKVRVAQLSGKPVAVVKLPDASATVEIEGAMLEQIPRAKTVISVLSPPFVRSDRCQRVVEGFWAGTRDSGHFEVDQHARLLNVVKTPVEGDEIAPAIRPLYARLSPYEFFERDPGTGRLREYDESFGAAAVQRFHERVYDVAYDVSQVLKHFGDPRPTGGGRAADPKTIFLAATTSDLDPQRDRLRRELVELGHNVVPKQPLPLVAADLVAVVEGCLERADIAVHFVGEHFGLVPEATELSVVALQNEVAADYCRRSALRRLIWVQRDVQPQDERQAAFLRRLQSEPAAVTGAELIADTLENLKVLMLSRWERERAEKDRPAKAAAAAGDVRRLYLICDQQDEEAIEPIEDFFYAQGIEVSLPAFEAEEADTQQIHIQNLRDCDAVLIYYGAASMHWVDFKLRDLQKAVGYREGAPIPAAAVYLAPPGHRRKDRFKSVLAEVVRQAGDAFDPADLTGFAGSIKRGKGADE